MIVTDARVQLEAAQRQTRQSHTEQRLDIRIQGPHTDGPRQAAPPQPSSETELTSAVRELDFSGPANARQRLQILILAELYQRVTGQSLRLTDPAAFQPRSAPVALPAEPSARPASDGAEPGIGIRYQRTDHYRETERLRVSGEGEVHTADGRALAFDLSLAMSRDYAQTNNLTVTAGNIDMTDPLVVNFDGRGAQLTERSLHFDLDSDGVPEQVAALHPGSGYLALDRNNDGRIGQGRELFGPQAGQGFAELAGYDRDGNGFIDEADPVYNRLRIWRQLEDGTSELTALADAQVGAIYLGHVSSPFQLTDAGNGTLGEVTDTGVYLKEDGSAGAVQQINLVV